MIRSTCFGHLYANHQEIETILVLLPHMVCKTLVAGGRRSGAGYASGMGEAVRIASLISSSPPYALRAPSNKFFSILSPEQYWVRSTETQRRRNK